MLLVLMRKPLVLVVIAAVLAGCVAPKAAQGLVDIPCDNVTGMNMEALFTATADESQLPTRLAALFNVPVIAKPQPPYKVENKTVDSKLYEWQIGTTRYRLITLDGKLQRAVVGFAVEHAPALSRVLECLGDPTKYHTRYKGPPDGRKSLSLDLYYPDRGIMVFVRVPDPWLGPHINPENPIQSLQESTPVEAIGWVQPSDIPTMRWHWQLPHDGIMAGSQAAFNSTQEWYYRTIRPWPGSIKALELTDTAD